MIVSDSSDHGYTQSSYVPGGTMTVQQNSIGSYINKQMKKIDELGQWQAVHIETNHKKIICITIYCIPMVTTKGKYSSITQYNQIKKEVKTADYYRRNILSSIAQYLASQQYNDLIIARDFNEDIFAKPIQSFFHNYRLKDTYTTINQS